MTTISMVRLNSGSDSFSGRLDTKLNTTTGGPFGVPTTTDRPNAGYLRDGVAFPRSFADYANTT